MTGQDRYGRSVATCSAAGEDLDRWMVRSGWALSFVRYGHTYDANDETARDTQVGLRAGAFIAPWDWRARNEQTVVLGAASVPASAQLGLASAGEAPDANCTIKDNVSRAGECIYHLPGGRFYSKVQMGASKREALVLQRS